MHPMVGCGPFLVHEGVSRTPAQLMIRGRRLPQRLPRDGGGPRDAPLQVQDPEATTHSSRLPYRRRIVLDYGGHCIVLVANRAFALMRTCCELCPHPPLSKHDQSPPRQRQWRVDVEAAPPHEVRPRLPLQANPPRFLG